MEKEFENLKNGQSGIFLVLKGMFGLLFRPLLDIWNLFKKEIIDNIINGRWKEFGLAIIPLFFIILFLIYSFNGLYQDSKKLIFSGRYEKVVLENYKQEVEEFFKKYEDRFSAHDCGFMREVGADELMYDKYGKTSYGNDYKCTVFDKVQRAKLLPISIGEIEKAGNKYKVRGELIRVDITDGKPLSIAPIRFELWKTINMEFWHFNIYGNAQTRSIKSEFKELN